MILQYQPDTDGIIEQDSEWIGIAVNVDLNRLVESVFLGPTTQPWFRELVVSVAKKYGLSTDVQQSSLANIPIL